MAAAPPRIGQSWSLRFGGGFQSRPPERIGILQRGRPAPHRHHPPLHLRPPLHRPRIAHSAGPTRAAADAFSRAEAPAERDGESSAPRFPCHALQRRDVTVPAAALRRGAVFKGTVSSVQKFGAFVDFGAFADGLVHVSKLSSGHLRNASDVVAEGQEVTVAVLRVERSSGRIALSMLASDASSRAPSRSGPTREGGDRSRFQSASARATLSTAKSLPVAPPAERSSRDDGERPYYQPEIGRRGGVSATPSVSTRGQAGEGKRSPPRPGWTPGRWARSKENVSGSRHRSGAAAADRVWLGNDPELLGRERSGRDRDASAQRGGGKEESFPTGSEAKFAKRIRIPGIDGAQDTKPRMKSVQRGNAERAERAVVAENRSRSRMRSWYDCECCY